MKKCSACGYPNPNQLTECFQCKSSLESECIIDFLEIPILGQPAKIRNGGENRETRLVKWMQQDVHDSQIYHIQVVASDQRYAGKVNPSLRYIADQEDINKPQVKQPKTITETRATCLACGNIWHFGAAEVWQDVGNTMSEMGNACTFPCCCLTSFMPNHPTQAPKQCPRCRSKAVKFEQVNHVITP